jgi:shikimate kinase
MQVRQDASLAKAFSKLNERLESQEVEREAEREQHKHHMEEMMKSREAAFRQEFMSMIQAAQGQGSFQQVIVMSI